MNPGIPITTTLPIDRIIDTLCNATYSSAYWCNEITWNHEPLDTPEYRQRMADAAEHGWDGKGWTAFFHGKNSGTVTVTDDEGEEHTVTLAEARANIQAKFTGRHLTDLLNEDDDGDTADVLLQIMVLGSHVYG